MCIYVSYIGKASFCCTGRVGRIAANYFSRRFFITLSFITGYIGNHSTVIVPSRLFSFPMVKAIAEICDLSYRLHSLQIEIEDSAHALPIHTRSKSQTGYPATKHTNNSFSIISPLQPFLPTSSSSSTPHSSRSPQPNQHRLQTQSPRPPHLPHLVSSPLFPPSIPSPGS